MKVKVYYQDFTLNSLHFSEGYKYIIKPEDAILVDEVNYFLDSKSAAVENIFHSFNMIDRYVDKAGKAGADHSSMSVGDFIVFEDGRIWVCAAMGWEKRHINEFIIPLLEDIKGLIKDDYISSKIDFILNLFPAKKIK